MKYFTYKSLVQLSLCFLAIDMCQFTGKANHAFFNSALLDPLPPLLQHLMYPTPLPAQAVVEFFPSESLNAASVFWLLRGYRAIYPKLNSKGVCHPRHL